MKLKSFVKKIFKQSTKGLDENGYELNSGIPVVAPSGLNRPPTLQEQIALMLRINNLNAQAEANGDDTWEEANDFEVGDDYDPNSPYEEHFDHVENFDKLRQKVKESKNGKSKKDDVKGKDVSGAKKDVSDGSSKDTQSERGSGSLKRDSSKKED